MAINGIGSGMGGYFDYYATLSQYRLQNALAQNPKFNSSITPVSSVSSNGSSFKSDSMDFLKSYNSSMSNLLTTANSLKNVNSKTTLNDFEVTSSDNAVASVSEHYQMREAKKMELNVEQLAAAQQNVSTGISGGAAASSDMSFSVRGISGTADVQVSMYGEDGAVKTNKQMLEEAASQINSSKSGVSASVVTKDGISSLELTSSDTGTNSTFTVSGELGAAAGLDKVSAEAQNAVYTVTENGQERKYSSQSNDVRLDYGRIDATLKQEGTTEISSAVSDEKIISRVSDMVDSYNSSLKMLNDNADHGSGVMRQLRSFAMDVAGSTDMEQAGISTNKDGTLSLDKEKLAKSLKEDPDLTLDILSGNNGIAQTVFNRASSAMRSSASSLLSNDLAQVDQMQYTDPFSFMNMYSKNGAKNLNNYYALGMMMNYLV